jgi:site-specific DNA recombinase
LIVTTSLIQRVRRRITEGFPPLYAVIYARASVDRRGRSVSVESQVKTGVQWCEENDVTVVAVLRDNNLSASRYATAERPDYAEALRLLSIRKANLLWTWENSRAQRELDVFVQLRRILIDIGGFWAYDERVWDMNNPDDRISTAEDAVEAEKESERLRKRVMRGKNTRALDGLWHGPKSWGLRKVWDQRTGECIALEPDEVEAPAAEEMCTRVLAGEAETVIAEDYNDRAILPPQAMQWRTCHVVKVHELSMDPVGWAELTRSLTEEQLDSACRIVTMMGAMEHPQQIVRVLNRSDAAHVFPGRWTPGKVRSAVLNPMLAGLKVHRGTIIGEGKWPKIIEPDDYYRLVAKLGDPLRQKVKDGTRIRNLLTGIALCGKCGGRIRMARRKTKTMGSNPYYVCNKGCRARAKEVTEAFVVETLLARLEDPNAVELFRLEVKTDALSEAMNKARDLRARLQGFIDQAVAGNLSPEALAQVEQKLTVEIEAAERQITTLGVSSVVSPVAGPQARETWASLRLEQQRAVLRAVLRVRLLPARKGRGPFDPATVQITWLTAPAEVPPALLAQAKLDAKTKGEAKASGAAGV